MRGSGVDVAVGGGGSGWPRIRVSMTASAAVTIASALTSGPAQDGGVSVASKSAPVRASASASLTC